MDPSRLRYVFAAFQLDPADKVLFHHGQAVPLTPKTFDTLVVLVTRHGRLVPKGDLLGLVWPDTFVEENNLAQHISTLRRVLGEGSSGDRFIETVPKRGYRFVAPVTEQQVGDDPRDITSPVAAPLPAGGTADALPVALPVAAAGRRTRRLQWLVAAAAAILLLATVLATIRDQPGRAGAATTPGRSSTAAPAAAAPGVIRMAVLPFANLGPAADASFVSGLAEELTSRLAGLRNVAVPSSTTLAAYERRGKTLTQIGADLRVDYAVEGSVRWTRIGDRPHVRMTPRLVRVADDTTVWTQQFETPVADLLKVQAEIANQITDALRVALDTRERQAVAARPTGDSEAYLAYLRGMALFHMGTSDTANLAAARAELEQAVARDPALAPAWSWLAQVYAAQYRAGAARTAEVMAKGMRAAEAAIALDPSRADLRFGRIEMLSAAGDHMAGLRELENARASLPNSAYILLRSSWLAQVRGRWREAQADFLRGFELDPALMAEPLAVHHLHLRQYDEARRFISVARAANQTGVTVPEAWTHFSERGDIAAARRVLETARAMRSPADGRVIGLLARFEWYDGKTQRALELIREMDAAGSWLAPNFRFPAALAAGQVYESLGRRQDATRNYLAAYVAWQGDQGRQIPEHRRAIVQALAAAGLGRTDEAVAHARRAVELLPVTTDATEAPLHLFLAAQVHARVGDYATTFATLEQLFSVAGFYSDQWVLHDPSFASLRRRPEFPAALARWSRQRGDVLLDGMRPESARPVESAAR